MSGTTPRVAVVPCSGIGKTHGSVSREAAYHLTEDLRPGETCLVALSLLVLGDEETRRIVAGAPAVTIDGCKRACARELVKQSGGAVAREFYVLEACRRHRHLKPRGIAELNEDAAELARVLAGEIASVVDAIRKG